MQHLAVNWVAVILAALASMALGFLWYMAFAKPWMHALGKTREQLISNNNPTPFIWSAAVQLVMAYFIALLTPMLFGETSVYAGMLCALHMWVGFVITSMIMNHRYQGSTWSLTWIDGGYLLGVLLVHGLVIGIAGNAAHAPPA